MLWFHAFMGGLEVMLEHKVMQDLTERLASFARVIRHDMRAAGLSGRATTLPDLETQIEIRAGAHIGEIETIGEDVTGVAVNAAARIAALAGPTEVLVSATLRDLIAGSGLRFESAGEHDLKGVPGRWASFRSVDDPE